ncbi:hypothetical protein [Streptosporangium sp. H16]
MPRSERLGITHVRRPPARPWTWPDDIIGRHRLTPEPIAELDALVG